jgi:hypothetical protein
MAVRPAPSNTFALISPRRAGRNPSRSWSRAGLGTDFPILGTSSISPAVAASGRSWPLSDAVGWNESDSHSSSR